MASTKLQQLFQDSPEYKRTKGQIIATFDANDTSYLIKEGFVKRYTITSDGGVRVQGIYTGGDLFPLTPMYSSVLHQTIYKGKETYFYEAITNVIFYKLDNRQLAVAVEKDPWLYKSLLVESGKRLESNIQRLENISLKTATERIAHYLVYLGQRFGSSNNDSIRIDLPLTQQDIGDNINMARETVSRTLTELEKAV